MLFSKTMNSQKLTKIYMVAVVVCGLACLVNAVVSAPIDRLDLQFGVLFIFTIGLGSRVTIQIPRFKSHISVSDTFIFLTLLLYGGEFAIILAAVEAFVASWKFCNRHLTIWFNAATMAIATTSVVFVLKTLNLLSESRPLGNSVSWQDFLTALCLIALVQFIVNTFIASAHDSMNGEVNWLDVWKSKYAWTILTYVLGAAGAGILVKLVYAVGLGALFAAIPIMLFVLLAYKMYLKNVEMSIEQAEKAREYADVLEERTNALRDSEQRFRSAFNYAPIGIALVSPAGNWLKVNHALCDILGYETDELLSTDFQSTLNEEDLPSALNRIHSILWGQSTNGQGELRFKHKSGRTVWTSWSVSTAGETRSEDLNLIFQLQDITSRKSAERQLQHDATHDALTGLPNRPYFMTRLAESLRRSIREPDNRVSVLFIDLDRFKNVNDSLGHLVGDHLLVEISKRLRECMRPTDTVARLGGDEFVILVEGFYDLEEVTRFADRIHDSFRTPFDILGNQIYTSASIGILNASENHLSSEDVMRDADTAMYSAKRAGKARHEVFDADMFAAARETLRLETDLRRAVEKDEFTVLYQPIVSLPTGELHGLEALARWNHPELGQIPPSKFVPLAEEIGWIDRLGEQVLTKACSQIKEIFNAFDGLGNVKLSVNLSCKQFANPDLVDRISSVLKRTEFKANRLKLEITESVFFEYQDRALELLHRLCELGIETDIDDFGTGYSNLSYLVRLPISTLKIDRSFIGLMGESEANREVIRTVISMAGNLGLEVVAEGIETEEQRDALKYLGCDLGQGYLFAKPMSVFELNNWLLEKRMPFVPSVSVAPTIETIQ